MCRNQLGRRNVNEVQKTILIGDAYNAQRMTQGTNNQYVQVKSENRQSGDFQKPGFRESILSGEVKAPKNIVSEIRNIPEEK